MERRADCSTSPSTQRQIGLIFVENIDITLLAAGLMVGGKAKLKLITENLV